MSELLPILDTRYSRSPRVLNRLTVLGDSRAAQMHAEGSPYRNRSAHNHRVWGDALADRRTTFGGNYGRSGWRSDQILALLNSAINSGCGTLDIQMGVNDISQAFAGYVAETGPYAGTAVTLANVLTVALANAEYAISQSVAAGIPNIIVTLDPGASNLTSEQVGILIRYNQGLRELAEKYPGVVIFDLPAYVWDPTASTAAAIAFAANAYLNEGSIYVHEATYGSWLAGSAYADLLKSIMPAFPRRQRSRSEAPATNNKTQMLSNPLFTSPTGGVAGTGVSGDIPASWNVARAGSGITASVSVAASPDGFGNEVVIAATATAAGSVYLYQDVSASNWALGDYFEGSARCIVDAGATGLAGPYLYTQAAFSGGSETSMDLYQRGEIGPQGGYSLDLLSQPLLISSVLGTKSWLTYRLYLTFAAAGSATVRWRTAAMRKRLGA